MLEILQNFESAMSGAERLSPALLIGPGVAAVTVGLFIWLGGLGSRRLLAAVAGAICGCVLACIAIGATPVPVAASIIVGVASATAFEKVFITALAAGLATATGIAVFIGPYLEFPPGPETVHSGEGSAQVTTLSGGHSIGKLEAWATDACEAIQQACAQMPAQKLALTVLLGLVLAVVGSLLWRLTVALYFSATGTMLVFAGMILLLLCKGVMPVTRICRRPSVYSGVFAAMMVFGTAEQLLLCRGGRVPSENKESGKDRSKIAR